MLKKTITYIDYDGNERTEDFYFNIDKKELIDLQFSVNGGIDKLINKAVSEKDAKKIIEVFEKIIQLSYGVKSPDGRRFIKNEEILEDFKATQAYNDLFMELAMDAKKASDFVNAIIPKLTKEEQEKVEEQKKQIMQNNPQYNKQYNK